MRPIFFCLFIFLALSLQAQQSYLFKITDSTTKRVLAGVSVVTGTDGVFTDSTGVAILSADFGALVAISYTGYATKRLSLANSTDTVFVQLQQEEEELEEVFVTSTRSHRTIEDIPTRVEAVTGEELAEKAVMQPGNVRMLLTESTGIQTQQTSAVSGSASIRIQGLEGRYTMLLKDGLPLYGGFSSGLSILQIPPLDLKRVELIKGSASTLYGGGAIAGLVNFISKTPGEEPEYSSMINVNQTGAADVSAFHSSRKNRWGNTVYVSYNGQREYDNNDDGLSDIPYYRRLSLNPKFFYYANNTEWQFGLNTTLEKRKGGDMLAIKGEEDNLHQYFEENHSKRYSTLFSMERKFGKNSLNLKNSVTYFDRELIQPQYTFKGRQLSTFTEMSFYLSGENSEWVGGINVYSDNFRQDNSINALDEKRFISGLFVQNNLKLSERFFVEAGLRTDYARQYKTFVLPRLSLMYKVSGKITSRLGGGLGYKLPTVFTEEAEERGFKNLQPVANTLNAETSEGVNWDINYRTLLNKARLSINQLFFFTRLHHPIVFNETPDANNLYRFYNVGGTLFSRGFETNIRLGINPFSFSLGYTFIDAKFDTANLRSRTLLTARHRLYLTSMYELEGKLRIAYELFYTGSQFTSTNERKQGYWVTGVSAERRWRHFSLFINAENFTDTRQSRFEPMFTGSITQPVFKPIWSNTEGFILNGGIRLFF